MVTTLMLFGGCCLLQSEVRLRGCLEGGISFGRSHSNTRYHKSSINTSSVLRKRGSAGAGGAFVVDVEKVQS